MQQDDNILVEGRGLLKKSAHVVMAKETTEIHLTNRKLFNYLLQRSYHALKEVTVHRIHVKEALEFLGNTSTASLHESLDRLGTVNHGVESFDDGEIRT